MSESQRRTGKRGRHHKLAAVLFADMVEFSRHMEEDEERTSSLASQSIELFKGLIGDYNGKVVNIAGDGILALFDSAGQAIRFAIQIQREFRDQAAWADGDPICFRVGLDLGEIPPSDANILAHCVNVAKRVQEVAEPGGVCATAAIQSASRDTPRFTFRSLGAPTLKNLTEPVEIFAVSEANGAVEPTVSPQRTAPEPSKRPAIAVLALENQTGDPADDHICQGIVEDVITNLSRFREFMVIARHSAFLFSLKSYQAREIGRRLGVNYVLAGSLRRTGRRVRIAVELIDTASESIQWSDRFDVHFSELLELFDEITNAAASRLAIQITLAERLQHPRDMRAYGMVLRGQHLTLRHVQETNAHARRLFEAAAEIVPDYGRAYSALSRTCNLDWRYAWSKAPDRSLDVAIEYAERAVQHDWLDARGFAELGFANLYKKRHDAALSEYRRAIVLNPNDADIIAEYADALVYDGHPNQAIELFDKATRLNPYYPDWYLWGTADAYNALGRSDEVISTVRRMRNLGEGRRLLAANYAHLGMLQEAQIQAAKVLRLHPGFTIGTWRHRPPYRDSAILERYVEGLRMAGLPD